MQPGGWHYNLLPFIDLNDLHQMGPTDTTPSGASRPQVVVQPFLCPSRHRFIAFPFSGGPYQNFPNPASVIGRSDYAGNAGSVFVDPGSLPSPGANIGSSNGPYNQSWNWAGVVGTLSSASSAACTGVICRATPVASAQVRDAYTYLIGERFIPMSEYNQSPSSVSCPGNDAGWDSGYDYNTVRWTGANYPNHASLGSATPFPPMQDLTVAKYATYSAAQQQQMTASFGSAHAAGFQVAFCDGNARLINYAISPTVHMQAGHRSDGEPTDESQFEANR